VSSFGGSRTILGQASAEKEEQIQPDVACVN